MTMKYDPLNWESAELWIANVNSEKDKYSEPIWNFDCGFKLDFDGPLIRVSSRFYPPHKNSGGKWSGDVKILFNSKELISKTFESEKLDDLRSDVEAFVDLLDFKLTIKEQ